MLAFMPWLGTGRLPALVSLTLIGLPLVLGHSITGLISINPETVEAAKATGMSDFQIFYDIRIPLALPSIITGISFASLSIAAGAHIAAYIGAGGIGSILFEGMRQTSYIKLFTGFFTRFIFKSSVEYIHVEA